MSLPATVPYPVGRAAWDRASEGLWGGEELLLESGTKEGEIFAADIEHDEDELPPSTVLLATALASGCASSMLIISISC